MYLSNYCKACVERSFAAAIITTLAIFATPSASQMTPITSIGVTTDTQSIGENTRNYFDRLFGLDAEKSTDHVSPNENRKKNKITSQSVRPSIFLDLEFPVFTFKEWIIGVKGSVAATKANMFLQNGITLNSTGIPVVFSEPVSATARSIQTGLFVFVKREIFSTISIGLEVGEIKNNIHVNTKLGDWDLNDKFTVKTLETNVFVEKVFKNPSFYLSGALPSVRLTVTQQRETKNVGLDIRARF